MSPEMKDAIEKATAAQKNATAAAEAVWKTALKEIDLLLQKTDLLEFHIDPGEYMILTPNGALWGPLRWLPLPNEVTEILESVDQYRVDEYGNEIWKKGEGWL